MATKKLSFTKLRELHSLMLGHVGAFGAILDESERRAAEGGEEDAPTPTMDSAHSTMERFPGLKRFAP